MKKKVLSLFICIAILISFSGNVFAQDEEVHTSYTLSLEDAIRMATEDSPQFISADVKIEDAKRQLKEAQKDKRNFKGVIRLPAMLSSVALKQGYYVKQAEIGVKSAEMEKVQAQSKVAYDVTQKYYGVKLSEALLESTRSGYQLALENKNTMDTQLSLGLVSELDVKNAEYAAAQAKNACDTYERSLDIAKKSLLISLSIDNENAQLTLTDDIEYEEFSSDLSEDIARAMNERYDIYSLKAAYEQAVSYRKVTEVLGLSSSEYSAANNNVIQMEYNYTNTKRLIALSINSSYNAILDAHSALKLAEQSVSIKEQEYDVAKIQYSLGMITNTQLTAAMNGVTNARIELENAKLTYKLAVKKYGYEISIGL